jgi:hypothetical protein
MKRILILMVMLLLWFSLSPEVVNKDKPLKGQWDFKLKKVWEIDQAGDELFGNLNTLLVSADGFIYVRDNKNHRTYIFDTDGKYLKFFAPRGEGPGEVRYNMDSYLLGDTFIIADFDRVHFFKKDGSFIKSVRNMFFRRRPAFFLNENEFIAAPVNIFQRSDRKGTITKVNLVTGKESVISEFQIFTGGDVRYGQNGPRRLIIIVGLTPLMTVGRGSGKLYYGISNTYKIKVTDLEGKPLYSFLVKRKNKKIAADEKKQLFSSVRNLDQEKQKQLIKNFPDEPTYFYHIEEIESLTYVFVPDPLSRFPGHQNPKQIDIFSAEGKYLYKADVKFERGLKPRSIPIKGNYLYAILEDENGELRIAKYQITFPQPTVK